MFGDNDPFQVFEDVFGGMNHVNSVRFADNFASQFRSTGRQAGPFGNVFDDMIRMVQSMSFNDPQQNRKPADKKAVARLPVVKIAKEHCKHGDDGKLEPPVCPICI